MGDDADAYLAGNFSGQEKVDLVFKRALNAASSAVDKPWYNERVTGPNQVFFNQINTRDVKRGSLSSAGVPSNDAFSAIGRAKTDTQDPATVGGRGYRMCKIDGGVYLHGTPAPASSNDVTMTDADVSFSGLSYGLSTYYGIAATFQRVKDEIVASDDKDLRQLVGRAGLAERDGRAGRRLRQS